MIIITTTSKLENEIEFRIIFWCRFIL